MSWQWLFHVPEVMVAELAPWMPRSCGHRMVLFSGLAFLGNVSGMRLEEKLRLGASVGVTELVRANTTNRDAMKAALGVRRVRISGSTPNFTVIFQLKKISVTPFLWLQTPRTLSPMPFLFIVHKQDPFKSFAEVQ